MLYDFTVKALSILALSTSNKVLQAIKRSGDQLFSYWCCWRFSFDAPDRNLPGELLQGTLQCHFSKQALGVSCRAWAWTGRGSSTLLKGKSVPRQEEIQVKSALKTTLVF